MTMMHYTELQAAIQARRPDFDNLLAILHLEEPTRPTLFEFFLNDRLYARLAGAPYTGAPDDDDGPPGLVNRRISQRRL